MAICIGLLLVIFLLSGVAQAQGIATLSCRLERDAILPDELAGLVIEVIDIHDLFGYQLKLNYPADLVEAVDEDPHREGVNLVLGTFLSPDFVVLNQADNANGVISLAMVQINPAPPKSGTGELAFVHLRGKAAGRVDFAFNEVILSSGAAEAIPHNLEGCTLQILDLSMPVPTETMKPTAVPLPTETSLTLMESIAQTVGPPGNAASPASSSVSESTQESRAIAQPPPLSTEPRAINPAAGNPPINGQEAIEVPVPPSDVSDSSIPTWALISIVVIISLFVLIWIVSKRARHSQSK